MTDKNVTLRLSSSSAREIAYKRARLIAYIRNYLNSNDYIEVDTPILYPFPEIAPMKQFKAIDPISGKSFYLRVCPTEHLKRLMVNGFDRVYEFSRNFRPGNSSPKHSCEFTSLECSQLHADYHDMMNLTEKIVTEAVAEIKGDAIVHVNNRAFDLSMPWKRVTVRDMVLDIANIDVLGIESVEEIHAKVKGVEFTDILTIDQAIDHIIETLILPTFTHPTFITEYPYALGGPAKPVTIDPRVKQRCEAFIGNLEIANMSTHLNDVKLLLEWHQRSLQIKEDCQIGDVIFDQPLFDAVSLGLPDSAVLGIGIDRLILLAVESSSILDVILFPFELM